MTYIHIHTYSSMMYNMYTHCMGAVKLRPCVKESNVRKLQSSRRKAWHTITPLCFLGGSLGLCAPGRGTRSGPFPHHLAWGTSVDFVKTWICKTMYHTGCFIFFCEWWIMHKMDHVFNNPFCDGSRPDHAQNQWISKGTHSFQGVEFQNPKIQAEFLRFCDGSRPDHAQNQGFKKVPSLWRIHHAQNDCSFFPQLRLGSKVKDFHLETCESLAPQCNAS